MGEHLSVQDLLTSLKYCKGDFGGSGCVGCPCAIPEFEDEYGLCKCRFNLQDEIVHLLETLIKNQ